MASNPPLETACRLQETSPCTHGDLPTLEKQAMSPGLRPWESESLSLSPNSTASQL